MTKAQIQRLLIIVGFSLLVIGVLVAIWFLFFQPLIRLTNTNESTNGNTNINAGQLPNSNVNRSTNTNEPVAGGPTALPKPSEVANGDLTLTRDLSTQTTRAATVGPDGKNILYYDDINDRFSRLDPTSGSIVSLSDRGFPEVKNVTWSPDAQRAVIEFPDDTKIVYDFSLQKQYTLPQQAQEFSFSADSKQLAYEFQGSGVEGSFLVTSNADGTGSVAVAKLADKASDVQVAWSPSDEVVGFFRKGATADTQEIVLIGQNQENFKTIPVDGRGFSGRWTPDGNRVLYTTYSEATNFNPELHLVLAKGDQVGQGDLNLGLQTSLSKCAFNPSGTHAYCAVPDLLERGSGLYPEFSSNVKDTIYSINLTSGTVTPLAQPVTSTLDRFTISSLFISRDDSSLFFTDQATRRLHTLRLK